MKAANELRGIFQTRLDAHNLAASFDGLLQDYHPPPDVDLLVSIVKRCFRQTPEKLCLEPCVPRWVLSGVSVSSWQHCHRFYSLAAVTRFTLSEWVSEMRAASKSDMRMLCLACSLQVVTLHWRFSFTTPCAISNLRFLPMCLRPPLFA